MTTPSDPFFTEPHHCSVRDRVLEVKPLPVRHLARAARHAEPLLRALAELPETGAPSWLDLMRHGDDLIALVSLATGLDEALVGDLDAAELIELAATVFEVNADFFTRRFLPAMHRLMAPAGPPSCNN